MTAPRNGKTGSRNPANKPTSVSAWKKSSQSPPIQLPSGNWMKIKKVGLPILAKTGMVPNSLMGIVQGSLDKGQGHEVKDEDLAQIAMDPKKIQDIADFMARMLIFVAEEPEVHPLPEDGVERDPELLYVDEVDFDDQMFIFQVVCGGTTDLETFRAEHGATMASLRGREDLELPAE